MRWRRAQYFLFAKWNRWVYNLSALGHSLMVEHRTLTPLVLVRIQLPQPRCATVRFRAVFIWFSNTCVEFESKVSKNVKKFELSN